MSDTENQLLALIDAAWDARRFARVKYSGFAVGAALEADDERIFTGANVESSSYGLTVCAERVALLKALSEGAQRFTRLVVVTDSDSPTSPCGACRQLLWDYARGIKIILVNKAGERLRFTLEEIYPHPFGDENP